MLDFGPPKEVLALALDPPNLENINSTVMLLKEVGALLLTTNGAETQVSFFLLIGDFKFILKAI
jgi:hypothetical protein